MLPIIRATSVRLRHLRFSRVGGLAVATALTLVFLPALYVAVNGIREKGGPAVAPVAAEHSLALQH